jgi:ATP-dependent DNA helicase RecG
MELETRIETLKGVGTQRGRLLARKGVTTVEDLLYYMPFRYEDRTRVKPLSGISLGETATVIGKITAAQLFQSHRTRTRLFEARLRDASGSELVGKWFRGDYLKDILGRGKTVAFYGKVERDSFSGEICIFHPEFEILDDGTDSQLHVGRIVPVYEAPGKMTTRHLRSVMHRCLAAFTELEDPLPDTIRRRLGFPNRLDALRDTHFPSEDADLRTLRSFRSPAQMRLIFEEFFFLECGLALKRQKARAAAGIAFSLNDRARNQIKKILPFKPTAAQKRVLREIADDMAQEAPMNRLLQGDVGSGKTIVALEAAVIALENDYQVAVMAPTEILATQHYLFFKRLLEPAGYIVVLLTGSMRSADKKKLKRAISEGLAHVVIGTHAVISDDVAFERLGFIVIDEQHRFGVMQRWRLLQKGKHPDVLVMTATPIPRTLALTFYGELDVSIIDELPPGRTPIVTRETPFADEEKVFAFVRRQVQAGRQVYVVCPLIEESETKQVAAAQDVYERLAKKIFPDLKVGLLHGRLPTPDKEAVMEAFKRNKLGILVSTTVVEVGVDVPNATVMLIMHAETFGLSQLHQLRGRVGRGAERSYCVLMCGDVNETARERIRTMVDTQDGFRIADVDLQLRGPGEFFGTKQSGLPAFRVADLIRDREVLELARGEAAGFVENPPDRKRLVQLVDYIRDKWQRRYGLVQVG